MSNNVRRIPPGRGLRRVERNGGEAFNVADARLTWKAKGEDTGYAFSVFEQQLGPGEGVPVMPSIVRGNTNAAVIAIAEKAADILIGHARVATR